MQLTDKERNAVVLVRKLALKWPKSLWLFSASGSLWIMKKNEDGEKAMLSNGGVDPDYQIALVTIENDGGDW